MSECNDAMCDYLSNKEVFADFFNGVLFDGNQEIKGENLDLHEKEYYGQKSSGHGPVPYRRRDILMLDRNGTGYVVIGLENQNLVHHGMPVRCMEYDSREYVRQMAAIQKDNRIMAKEQENFWEDAGEFLSGLRKGDKLNPVVTVTFFHGNGEYEGCMELHNMLNWNQENEKYKPFVGNYHMNLVNLKDISEEKFKTGLRELIGVMKRSEDKAAFDAYCTENEERFRNLDAETYQAISALTKQWDFMKYQESCKNEVGGIDMCKAIMDMKEEAMNKGIRIGIEQGIEQGIKGIERINKLVHHLVVDNRIEDLTRSSLDKEYQKLLLDEYNL